MPPEQARCPVCAGDELAPVLEVAGVPVFCNVLWETRDEALAAARGDIALVFCEACGTIHNSAFDPALVRYSPAYENSLHFSGVFREFEADLTRRLIAEHGLSGRLVVDIGCGDGHFLRRLCGGAGNRGIGFDPSYAGPPNGEAGVSFVREYWSEAHAEIAPDFISCRHVLEHLGDPRALLQTLAGSTATLYFEVPDGEYMLREAACWDVIYEHVSYFTAPALRRLFGDFGFAALATGSSFGGQYLYIEAARDRGGELSGGSGAGLTPLVERFSRSYAETVAGWTERLAELRSAGRRVAVWGAGSKGVTFLNAVGGGGEVDLVIDVSERKHGRFAPGTGQQVRAPEAVREERPDAVVAMNPLYVEEIRRHLAELDVEAEVVPA